MAHVLHEYRQYRFGWYWKGLSLSFPQFTGREAKTNIDLRKAEYLGTTREQTISWSISFSISVFTDIFQIYISIYSNIRASETVAKSVLLKALVIHNTPMSWHVPSPNHNNSQPFIKHIYSEPGTVLNPFYALTYLTLCYIRLYVCYIWHVTHASWSSFLFL